MASLLPLISLCQVADATAAVAGGVLRARGKQVSLILFFEIWYQLNDSTGFGCYAQHKCILHSRLAIGCLLGIQASLWVAWHVDKPHFCVSLLWSNRNVDFSAGGLERGSTEGSREVERGRQKAQGVRTLCSLDDIQLGL